MSGSPVRVDRPRVRVELTSLFASALTLAAGSRSATRRRPRRPAPTRPRRATPDAALEEAITETVPGRRRPRATHPGHRGKGVRADARRPLGGPRRGQPPGRLGVLSQRADELARLVDRLLAASAGDGPRRPVRAGRPFNLLDALRRAARDLPEELREAVRLDLPDGPPGRVRRRRDHEPVDHRTGPERDPADPRPGAGRVRRRRLTRGGLGRLGGGRHQRRDRRRPSSYGSATAGWGSTRRTSSGRSSGSAGPPGTRPRYGVGLGLYLVRRLVERQNGWVSLRPREGGGTVAEVRLPCGRVPAGMSRARTRHSATGASRRGIGSCVVSKRQKQARHGAAQDRSPATPKVRDVFVARALRRTAGRAGLGRAAGACAGRYGHAHLVPELAEKYGDREVTLATVLPMAWPALTKPDGRIFVGLQRSTQSGDVNRDIALSLLLALEAPFGGGFSAPEIVFQT